MSPARNARTAVLHRAEEADAVRRGGVCTADRGHRGIEKPKQRMTHLAKNKSTKVGHPRLLAS